MVVEWGNKGGTDNGRHILTGYSMDELGKHYAKQDKPDTKEPTFRDPTYTRHKLLLMGFEVFLGRFKVWKWIVLMVA